MAAPQGKRPTLIVVTAARSATSITVTSPETPLVVNNWLKSGEKAKCQTRRPTRI